MEDGEWGCHPALFSKCTQYTHTCSGSIVGLAPCSGHHPPSFLLTRDNSDRWSVAWLPVSAGITPTMQASMTSDEA
jgi:hypothetical protein